MDLVSLVSNLYPMTLLGQFDQFTLGEYLASLGKHLKGYSYSCIIHQGRLQVPIHRQGQ